VPVADAGVAEGSGALVADHAAGEVGENDGRGVSEWRKIQANGLPTEG